MTRRIPYFRIQLNMGISRIHLLRRRIRNYVTIDRVVRPISIRRALHVCSFLETGYHD
jgi:hypothetical protein